MVSVHNLWTGPLAVVVSVFSWGALIEGVLMLAVRRQFLGLVNVVPFTGATTLPFGIAAIVLGLVLLYAGLA